MAKYYVMGNFSQKGVKGFLTGDSNRESVVKSACEAMGCKFISYDITEGEFDFILVLEGDSEQIIAAKGGAMMSDDFDKKKPEANAIGIYSTFSKLIIFFSCH